MPDILDLRRATNAFADVIGSQPMTPYMAAACVIPQTAAVLLSALGAAAVLLAALGIYGVVAWTVGRRIREVGVRVALGAERRDVVWMFLRQGLSLAGIGMGLGALGAVLAARTLGGLMVEVSPLDPWTYLVSLATLGLVATVACWIPARRASRIDPLTALRTD